MRSIQLSTASAFVVVIAFVASPLLQADDKKGADAEKSKKAAAKKSVDPSGTWRMEYEWEGRQIKDAFRLQLGKNGKVVGHLHRGEKVAKVQNGKIDGDRISFKVTVNYDGNDWVTQYTGKIKGDEIDGAVVLEVNDQKWDFRWTPKRSVELTDVVGEWRIRIELPDGGALEPTLKIERNGEKYKPRYTSQQGQALEVKNLRVEKNQLLFTITADVDGNSLKADYRGRPYGNKYSGKIDYDYSGDTGTVEFTARRKQPEKKKVKKSEGADN